jgi:hypothetical protein
VTPPEADTWLVKDTFTWADVLAGQGSDSPPMVNAQLVAVTPIASLT